MYENNFQSKTIFQSRPFSLHQYRCDNILDKNKIQRQDLHIKKDKLLRILGDTEVKALIKKEINIQTTLKEAVIVLKLDFYVVL